MLLLARNCTALLTIFLVLHLFGFCVGSQPKENKPNIIIILADDMVIKGNFNSFDRI